jgi:hypothetical protein
MPRRSFAALMAPPMPGAAPRRLEPPPTLPDAQKKVWADIVIGTVPGHFRPSDAVMLRHLTFAMVKAEHLTQLLEPETDPARLAALFDAYDKALATIARAGSKLRLWQERNRPPTIVPEPSPLERLKMRGLI